MHRRTYNASFYNNRHTFCAEPLAQKEKLEEDKVCKSKNWEYKELSDWSQKNFSILNEKGDVVLKQNGTTTFTFDRSSNHYCVSNI